MPHFSLSSDDFLDLVTDGASAIRYVCKSAYPVAVADFDPLKARGNTAFKSLNFEEAVFWYTQALSVGREPTQAAVALGNRAAALLEAGRAQDAARDCEWALATDSHPNAAKIEARLARCKGKIVPVRVGVDSPGKRRARPESSSVTHVDRGLVASSSCRPGDALLTLEPALAVATMPGRARLSRCHHCLTSMPPPVVFCRAGNPVCTARFCSQQCAQQCPSHVCPTPVDCPAHVLVALACDPAFLASLEDNSGRRHRWSRALVDAAACADLGMLASFTKEPPADAVELAARSFVNIACYTMAVKQPEVDDVQRDDSRVGDAVFRLACRANHSCLPTARVRVTRCDGAVCASLLAVTPVPAGDPVTISYLACPRTLTTTQRKEHLLAEYNFTCRCDMCAARE